MYSHPTLYAKVEFTYRLINSPRPLYPLYTNSFITIGGGENFGSHSCECTLKNLVLYIEEFVDDISMMNTYSGFLKGTIV